MRLESKFQKSLIDSIEARYSGAVVLMNDAQYIQGVPDLLILYKSKWAMLEVKQHAKASRQPNQTYYVDLFDTMSFGAVIYPENEHVIFSELDEFLLS